MKVRLISAAIALVFLAIVMLLFETIVLNLAVSVLAVIAVFELLQAKQYIHNKFITTACLLFAAMVPFFKTSILSNNLTLVCYLFVVILLLALIASHAKLKIEELGFAVFCSLSVSFSFYTVVFIRDTYGVRRGLYYLLLVLALSFLTDTGAYFAGRAFGKHKMAPIISPHKTVEGAIGGVIFCTAVTLLLSWGYQALVQQMGYSFQVNFWFLLIISPLCSLVSMVGDLSASVIKRQCGIKDFGNIMPGHGGIMDRFDSVLLVAPLVYILVQLLPIVTI